MAKRKKKPDSIHDWQPVDDQGTLLYTDDNGKPLFLIEHGNGLAAAVALLAEKQDQGEEIERMMDEEYGVLDLVEEMVALQAEITRFMSANHIRQAPVEGRGRWQLITPSSGSWDMAAVKEKVGDKTWRKITRRVLDPNLLDQAVKAGTINQADIQDAYVQKDSKPYTKFYANDKKADHENEADELAAFLGD